MIALLQRVTSASVEISSETVGEIGAGMLVFLAVQKQDTHTTAESMLQKILSYRIFSDNEGKMNKSVCEVERGILLVPQFTLAADTKKGLRPNFSTAAPPEQGKQLFDYFLDKLKAEYDKVSAGVVWCRYASAARLIMDP